MNHIAAPLKLNCFESMISSYDQLIQIPGVKEIIEASSHGRGLLLNIKACRMEIEKIERNYSTEASKVGTSK